MKRLALILAVCVLFPATRAFPQQAHESGDYSVHYNALTTSMLTPQVAQSYGIQRSASRALLNITVMKHDPDGAADFPVKATVQASATNLTGQRRDIVIREIMAAEGAVYYIGEMRVRNLETFNFAVTVIPEGETEAIELGFRQQFYTE